MKLEETQLNCQIPCLQDVADGIAEVPLESLSLLSAAIPQKAVTYRVIAEGANE